MAKFIYRVELTDKMKYILSAYFIAINTHYKDEGLPVPYCLSSQILLRPFK